MKQQAIFKALADPSRRQIIKQLRSGSKTAGELAAMFDFSAASLSHHFSVLKAAELVRTERRGQYIVYSLNMSVFQEMSSLFMELFGTQEHK